MRKYAALFDSSTKTASLIFCCDNHEGMWYVDTAIGAPDDPHNLAKAERIAEALNNAEARR